MLNLQKYWRKHHINKNRHLLTGTSGVNTWKCLGVTDKIVAGRRILEIGVGLGYSIIAMAGKGVHTSAMDIVPEAFECVKNIVEHTYLAGVDELPKQYFDLVISFNVTCHQSDDTLKEQIKAVMKSLKPDGIFALGVAGNGPAPWPADWQPQDKSEIETLEAGAKVRSEDEIEQIVSDAGGQIIFVGSPLEGLNPSKTYIYSYAVHIKKVT